MQAFRVVQSLPPMAYNCRTGETGGSDEGHDDWTTIGSLTCQMEMLRGPRDRHSLVDARAMLTAEEKHLDECDADSGLLGEQR